jgi:hypothetical protein
MCRWRKQRERPPVATLTLVPKKRATILVVNDDPDLPSLVYRLLDDDG